MLLYSCFKVVQVISTAWDIQPWSPNLGSKPGGQDFPNLGGKSRGLSMAANFLKRVKPIWGTQWNVTRNLFPMSRCCRLHADQEMKILLQNHLYCLRNLEFQVISTPPTIYPFATKNVPGGILTRQHHKTKNFKAIKGRIDEPEVILVMRTMVVCVTGWRREKTEAIFAMGMRDNVAHPHPKLRSNRRSESRDERCRPICTALALCDLWLSKENINVKKTRHT